MKMRLHDKGSEIEVLKEMVKSASMQAKAKDIDISRLTRRIQRLEKFSDLSKRLVEPLHKHEDVIEEAP